MKNASILVLILGLTVAVLVQADYLSLREGFTTRLFDGDTHRPFWSGRVLTAGLADLVDADNNVASWVAGWYLLSALAWFAARRERAVGPVALLAVVALAAHHPLVPFGIVASDGPVMFFFTLAAITRRKAAVWWPIIGFIAIPFKQTGGALVAAAALLWLRDGRWRGALYMLGAAFGIGRLAAGTDMSTAFTMHSYRGKLYSLDNLRHMTPAVILTCGGTVLAGLLSARGIVLLTMGALTVAVLVMGQAWEPRIWFEVAALGVGVLADGEVK